MDFSSWKIVGIIFKDDWGIDRGRLHFDFSNNTFEIIQGTRPSKWEGLSFKKKDMPLILAHEKAHAKHLVEGIDQAVPRLFLFPDSLDLRQMKLEIIKNEIRAWKGALMELEAEEDKDWFEKAQAMISDYVFNLLK